MITTIDYFRLNEVLVKMVLEQMITSKEREELLHKAGLLKLENQSWKMTDGSILTFA